MSPPPPPSLLSPPLLPLFYLHPPPSPPPLPSFSPLLSCLSQAQRRMETSRVAANNADQSYQEAVKNLEESRHLWERELELLCKVSRSHRVTQND